MEAQEPSHKGMASKSASILVSGVASPAGRLLTLLARRIAPVSYATSTRRIDVVPGASLESLLPKEPFGRMRLATSIVMPAGTTTIPLAG